MKSNPSHSPVDYSLVKPDVERDAPFAVKWFNSTYGKETLLKMGNPESAIKESTLTSEKETLLEFLKLEREKKQLTWMIRADDKTIGAVWIELVPTEHLAAPAVHIMIGNVDYRGHGIGTSVMREMIDYTANVLKSPVLYSRYLRSNAEINAVTKSIGFIDDGEPYQDKDGLVWQNIQVRR